VNAPRLIVDAPLAHLRWGDEGPDRRALVVLLHGIGGGREGWASTGAALAAAGLRALAADLPGYGFSPAIEPWTLATMASAVERLIATSGVDAAVLVGHSLGGMVAQELVACTPQRVSHLVLAGTSPAFGSADGVWQQDFLRSRFEPLDAGLGMPGLAAQLVPAMAGRDAGAERIAAAQALMAGVPEATYRRVLAALVRFDRRDALPRIAVPTLVIAGEDDRTASPEVARRMAARIPGAELAILPRTGHLLMLEQPAAFDAELIAFLQRHPIPDPAGRPEEVVHVRRA
jgi:pimeloyl-ACP methyl ester carboxylesterase